MNANPFIIVAAFCNVAGVFWHLAHGEYKMAAVWICYATATFILSFAK